MDISSIVDLSAYILPAAILLVLLALLLIALPDARSRRGTDVKAQGIVSGFTHDKGERGDTFTPKVRFTSADGRDIEIVDGFGVSRTAPEIGSPVNVLYPAGSPERGRVAHPGRRIFTYAFLMGLLVLLLALYFGNFNAVQR